MSDFLDPNVPIDYLFSDVPRQRGREDGHGERGYTMDGLLVDIGNLKANIQHKDRQLRELREAVNRLDRQMIAEVAYANELERGLEKALELVECSDTHGAHVREVADLRNLIRLEGF